MAISKYQTRAKAPPAATRSQHIADDPERAAQLAEVLRAVAHPLRLRILDVLVEGEAHVTAMAERLGVGQPAVSQELRILRMQGLVEAVREQGFARYRIVEEHLRDLLGCLERCAVR